MTRQDQGSKEKQPKLIAAKQIKQLTMERYAHKKYLTIFIKLAKTAMINSKRWIKNYEMLYKKINNLSNKMKNMKSDIDKLKQKQINSRIMKKYFKINGIGHCKNPSSECRNRNQNSKQL